MSRTLQLLLLIAIVTGLFHGLVTRPRVVLTGDLLSYVAAGRGIANGVDVYDDAEMGPLWAEEFGMRFSNRYIYPPLLATALSPVAHADPERIRLWWSWINLLLTVALALLLAALLLRFATLDTGAGAAVFALLLVAAMTANVPLYRSIVFTQVNVLVLDLVLGAVLLYRRMPIASAALLCLAANVKMAPALLALPVLFARNGRWLAAFAATQLALFAVTLIYGLDPWRSFLAYTSHNVGIPVPRSTSIDSLVTLLVSDRPWEIDPAVNRLPILAAKGVVVALATWVAWRRRRALVPVERSMIALLPVMMLVSPYAWVHGHLFVLPTLLMLAVTATGATAPVLVAVAGVSICLVPVINTFPWSFHRMASLILLVVVWMWMPTARPRGGTGGE